MGKHRKRIMALQKKAVRYVCKSHFNSHTEPRMKKLGLLKFEDIYLLQCAKFAYTTINGDSPPAIKDKFKFANEIHDYALRSRTHDPLKLIEPRTNTRKHLTYLTNNLPITWNKIPQNIRSLNTLTSFRNKLKGHLLSRYRNQVRCNNPFCRDFRLHET